MRAKGPGERPMHTESLLRIPLVRQMMSDPHVGLVGRRVDCFWHYEDVVPVKVGGFNPFHSSIYYASRSLLAEWLAAPTKSARSLNENDHLVKEVLWAVHDYLHCWALGAIARLAPKLGLGRIPITRKNAEDLVFGHVLSEAVATLGLDYWYLACTDLNTVCPIGTCVRGLTAAYDERLLGEYRRFNRTLDVQRPDFFTEFARFYCTGEFPGFDARSIGRSAALLKWLSPQIVYATKEREYIRRWLTHLSGEDLGYEAAKLERPIACDAPWQRRLIAEIGVLLWEKVKEDKLHPFARPKGKPWHAPEGRTPDFRFTNWNSVSSGPRPTRPMSADEFEYWFWQMVSAHRYDACDPELFKLFPTLLEKRDAALALAVMRHQPAVSGTTREPQDLFLLN
jgi:hypothetical protein